MKAHVFEWHYMREHCFLTTQDWNFILVYVDNTKENPADFSAVNSVRTITIFYHVKYANVNNI